MGRAPAVDQPGVDPKGEPTLQVDFASDWERAQRLETLAYEEALGA